MSIESPTTAERQFVMMLRACLASGGVSPQFALDALITEHRLMRGLGTVDLTLPPKAKAEKKNAKRKSR